MSRSRTPQRSSPPRAQTPTRESKLLRLVQDYHLLTLLPWGSRVSQLELQLKRALYLGDGDAEFLVMAHSKNVAFMRNLEAVMEDAVHSGVGIESGAVRRAYSTWAQSEELNQRIQLLRERYAHAFAVKNGGRRSSPVRRNSPTPSSGRRTPSRPRCLSYEEVGEQLGKTTPQQRDSKPHVVQVQPEARSLLQTLEMLSTQPASQIDKQYARGVFLRIYGAQEGPRQFHKWFDEQAVKEVRRSVRMR